MEAGIGRRADSRAAAQTVFSKCRTGSISRVDLRVGPVAPRIAFSAAFNCWRSLSSPLRTAMPISSLRLNASPEEIEGLAGFGLQPFRN